MNKKVLLFLTFVGLSFAVNSQSLQEFINLALANNYQIRILKNDATIASNNNTVGNSGQLPTVDLKAGFSTAFNNTHQEFSDGSIKQGSNAQNSNMTLSLLANWTVFDGFGVYAKKDQLEYLQDLGDLNAKYYIEQTVADIVTVYYQMMYEDQLRTSFKQSLTISLYRLKLEEKKKSVGSGKMIDYGQALVDYQSDSIRFMNQENRIQSLKIELNRILNNDLALDLIITENEFSFAPLSAKDSIFLNVEKNNLLFGQEQLKLLISETQLRMEKSNRYPQIDVFAGYQYAQSSAEVGFIQLNRNLGPVVGLSISYNLFSGGQTNTAIKNTLLENENAQLNMQQVQHNINAETLNLYYQYNSLSDRISLAKSNVEMMQKVTGTATDQLAGGTLNGYDYRLTQLSLLNTQLSLIELQLALKLVEVNLNRLSGKVLETYL